VAHGDGGVRPYDRHRFRKPTITRDRGGAVSTALSDTDRPAPTVDGAVPGVVVWVAVALVAVPFVVAALSVIGVHWNPAGDQAIEVMRIRDVGTGHTPLIGQWSR